MIMVFIQLHTVIVAQKRDREIGTFDSPLRFCEKDVWNTLKKIYNTFHSGFNTNKTRKLRVMCRVHR